MALHESDDEYDAADAFHQSSSPSFSTRFPQFSRPLIESVRNGWQYSNAAYHSLSISPDNDKHPPWVQMALSIAAAPRFRRFVAIYSLLFLMGWAGWAFLLYPRLQERSSLLRALNPATKAEAGGWFGTNSLPRFDDIIQIRTLDPSILPVAPLDGEDMDARSQKRLIVIGDVHGCKTELTELLQQISFSTTDGDHLIFAGDMINKGPDSSGVLDLAREYSATCVRGNHEDRVLLMRHEIEAAGTLAGPEAGDEYFYAAKELKERTLARSLSAEQVQWLDGCPVILNVGPIPGMGNVVVVHGGLVPGVELERQDPSSVMNMRTIDLDTHVPSSSSKGMNWAKMFDKHQSLQPSNLRSGKADPHPDVTTVIYGHDSKTGLSIRTYTKGLDSGCVKGGKLTALVIEDGGKQSIVQVRCKNYLKDEKDK